MSASDSADMKDATIGFDWVLSQDKIRDGQHGPVFLALRADTGELITADKWDLEGPGDSSLRESIVSHLGKKQMSPSQPNIVSYLGYQLKEGHIFVLREHLAAGTLQDFIQKHSVIPQPLIRGILRQVLLGLKQLQGQGFAVVFLDAGNIMMDNKARIKIEAPILDMTITGHPLPSAVLTVPEILLSQGNMRKTDVWLFGIVAAQLVSGDCSLSAAIDIATRIQQADGSAWEVPIPPNVKRSELDKQASDPIRKCFTS
ncbi:hypothetical protein INS49_005359 [Diaporthe citri]|uniref:uncharacterized protein n=1 Tax=Diaporthe citri TaxID=83186 RepID=UPI001C7F14BD|nr:uncharacterized protein INS49_005359 [Diaporthe citri]KAG6353651.1 hypothetical protein INS49_005359 [Diaporthe citri]